MDKFAFFRLLARRWWLLVLFGAIGAGTAIVSYRVVPKNYASSVTIALNPGANSGFLPYSDSSSTSGASGSATSSSAAAGHSALTLAASYGEILHSRSFADLVISRLNLDVDPITFSQAIRSSLVPSTNIFRISVTWNHPVDAQTLAQRVTEIFMQENEQRQLTETGVQDRLDTLQGSARDLLVRIVSMQAERDRLEQAVTRGQLGALRDLNDLENRLGALQSSYTSALVDIDHIRTGLDTASIIDTASPAKPTNILDLPTQILVGVLIGVAVAIAVANLLDSLQDAVRSPRDLVKLTGEAPMGIIVQANRGAAEHPEFPPGLIMLRDPRSRVAEAFRGLATHLGFVLSGQAARAVIVTSAGPGEGKSFVASNLAIAFAQAGKRVVLIDGDLRRPSLHTVFGVPNQGGLVGAITSSADRLRVGAAADGAASFDHGLLTPTRVSGLMLLTAGHPPANASGLLGSEACAQLIAAHRRACDIVIIDSAPVVAVADTLTLAASADGILVVARAGKTPRGVLRNALQALQQPNRPILGIALNGLRPSVLERYSPYTYAYYDGYYAPDRRNGNGVNGQNGHNGQVQNGHVNGASKSTAETLTVSQTEPGSEAGGRDA